MCNLYALTYWASWKKICLNNLNSVNPLHWKTRHDSSQLIYIHPHCKIVLHCHHYKMFLWVLFVVILFGSKTSVTLLCQIFREIHVWTLIWRHVNLIHWVVIASALFPGVLVSLVNSTTKNLFLAFLTYQLRIWNILNIKDQRSKTIFSNISVFNCNYYYKLIVILTQMFDYFKVAP